MDKDMDVELQGVNTVNSSSDKSPLPSDAATKQSSRQLVAFVATISISLIAVALAIYFGVSLRHCRRQDSSKENEQTPVDWIKAHAHNISFVQTPVDDTFADLIFLSDMLKDVDVLWIGETNHGDGSIHSMRTRIIKYLHQCCGFNTIAFEVALFDGLSAYTDIVNLTDATRTDENVAAIFKKNIPPAYWGNVEETQELFQYIAEKAPSDNPLEFTGYVREQSCSALL
jgi:hypothetical protein